MKLATLLLVVGAVSVAALPAEAKKVKVPAVDIPAEPAAPESLAYYVDELPYRVAPGDLLDVDFGVDLGGQRIRENDVLVRPDGMITLNPVGDIRAAGLTTTDLDSVLMIRFAEVYREPRITVGVAKMAGNFVHVFGSVRSPGSFEITPNATVMQAIARAGGVTPEAALGSVVLMRRTGPSSLVARKVQVNRAIAQGIAGQDPYVRRFDIVYVPKTTIASINQFVDQFFAKMIPVPQAYIFGWEAFHIERVFPATRSDTVIRPEL
ncbi:MAG: polysaccharide biosynthesis/export family protein [Candidatus Eiseniibacteriota bacterium]